MPSRLTTSRLHRQQGAATRLAGRHALLQRPEPGRRMFEALGLRERLGVARATRSRMPGAAETAPLSSIDDDDAMAVDNATPGAVAAQAIVIDEDASQVVDASGAPHVALDALVREASAVAERHAHGAQSTSTRQPATPAPVNAATHAVASATRASRGDASVRLDDVRSNTSQPNDTASPSTDVADVSFPAGVSFPAPDRVGSPEPAARGAAIREAMATQPQPSLSAPLHTRTAAHAERSIRPMLADVPRDVARSESRDVSRAPQAIPQVIPHAAPQATPHMPAQPLPHVAPHASSTLPATVAQSGVVRTASAAPAAPNAMAAAVSDAVASHEAAVSHVAPTTPGTRPVDAPSVALPPLASRARDVMADAPAMQAQAPGAPGAPALHARAPHVAARRAEGAAPDTRPMSPAPAALVTRERLAMMHAPNVAVATDEMAADAVNRTGTVRSAHTTDMTSDGATTIARTAADDTAVARAETIAASTPSQAIGDRRPAAPPTTGARAMPDAPIAEQRQARRMPPARQAMRSEVSAAASASPSSEEAPPPRAADLLFTSGGPQRSAAEWLSALRAAGGEQSGDDAPTAANMVSPPAPDAPDQRRARSPHTVARDTVAPDAATPDAESPNAAVRRAAAPNAATPDGSGPRAVAARAATVRQAATTAARSGVADDRPALGPVPAATRTTGRATTSPVVAASTTPRTVEGARTPATADAGASVAAVDAMHTRGVEHRAAMATAPMAPTPRDIMTRSATALATPTQSSVHAPASAPASAPAARATHRALDAAPRPLRATPTAPAARSLRPDASITTPLATTFAAGSTREREPTSAPAPKREAGPAPTPVAPSTRRLLQPLVGIDPQSVRVHRGAAADAVAAAHAADAVATRGEVVMGAAHPESSTEGLALLAHELVHVARERTPGFEPPIARATPRAAIRAAAHVERDEERVALDVEAQVREAARRHDAPWGALPAPWEPLPDTTDAASVRHPAAEPTSRASAHATPAATPATAAPAAVHTADRTRSLPTGDAPSPDAPATQAARGDGGGPATPGPDVDALARQVYDVLKRRLAAERRRGV